MDRSHKAQTRLRRLGYEGLEDRHLLACHPVPTTGFAVLGDSNSDEYRADDNRGGAFAATTLNWVEQLALSRGLDFGRWGTWSEPRRSGYEYNWARSGATASDMISSGQHIGVAQQIASGEVSYVFVNIGANDFHLLTGAYQEIYDGTLSDTQVQDKIDTFVADVTTAVDVLVNGGAQGVVVANVADPGIAPPVEFVFPESAGRQRVTDAINMVNAGIDAMVASRGVILADQAALALQALNELDENGFWTIAGELVNAFVPGNEPHHGNLPDPHAGTLANAKFFVNDLFLDALRTGYELPIAHLSDTEMLENAGILPPPVPSIESFAATPLVVSPGSVTELCWDVQSASRISIDQGIGHVPVSGTLNVTPAVDTIFTLTASAPGGNTSFSIDINVNQPPVGAADADSVTEDDPTNTVSGNLLVNDSDPDGDPLSVSQVAGSVGNIGVDVAGSYGTVRIESDGGYRYTLDNSNVAVDGLEPGETLTDSIAYTLTDGVAMDTVHLTVTVQGTHDNIGPTAASDSVLVMEDTSPLPVTSNVLTNDNDPEDDLLSVDRVNGALANVNSIVAGSYGTLLLRSDGSFDYTLDNSNPTVNALDVGQTLSETFTYRVTDSQLTDTATLTVTIQGMHDNVRPTARDDQATAMVNGTPEVVSGNVLVNDSDPENDPLAVTAVNGDDANVGEKLLGRYGELLLDVDGSYSYQLDHTNRQLLALEDGETVAELFSYTVSDGQATHSAQLEIIIERHRPSRIPGDSNGDGQFDSSDLILVFQAGEYEDGIEDNSTFAEGDWNGDGEFDSTDLVFALQHGNFVRAAIARTRSEHRTEFATVIRWDLDWMPVQARPFPRWSER